MSILKRLDDGEVIIGDGSYMFTLEKRCLSKAGDWTPEASCEKPDSVKELALEFAWAGGDVTQTFTFYSTDDKLPKGCKYTCREINKSACNIAKAVVQERGTILAGGISQTGTFRLRRNKEEVQAELKRALEVFQENDLDLIIVEYFRTIMEMEWAIEIAKTLRKPVAATMCIGPKGDEDGIPVGECAVRMARAGANIIGVNCLFDPFITLQTMKLVKEGLEKANLKAHLMAQPLGYRTPDAGSYGWITIPEYPYAVEPRHITRWEAARFAREAYDMGIRYIGGCCGFEPYHIRAMAEELKAERKRLPEGSNKTDLDLAIHKETSKTRKEFANKGEKEFWLNMHPCTGRVLSSALCQQPDPHVVPSSILK